MGIKGKARNASNVQAWRPIETAPKDGTAILIYEPFGGDGSEVYVCRWQRENRPGSTNEWWTEACGERYGHWKPTHWMPLPDPPDEARTACGDEASVANEESLT